MLESEKMTDILRERERDRESVRESGNDED
jgi:hypothetical protein